jgi:hypothetical protein
MVDKIHRKIEIEQREHTRANVQSTFKQKVPEAPIIGSKNKKNKNIGAPHLQEQ